MYKLVRPKSMLAVAGSVNGVMLIIHCISGYNIKQLDKEVFVTRSQYATI